MTLKLHVLNAIQSLWDNPSEDFKLYGDTHVLDKLSRTTEDNDGWHMDAMCGTTSYMMMRYMPPVLAGYGLNVRVDVLTSDHKDNFHLCNRITDLTGAEEPVFCDMSIAQFLTKPLQALDDKPYFVGTQAELKELVLSARSRTIEVMQENFPALPVVDIFDLSLPSETLRKAHSFLEKTGKQAPSSLMRHLYVRNIWEAGWGDEPVIRYSTFSQTENFLL